MHRLHRWLLGGLLTITLAAPLVGQQPARRDGNFKEGDAAPDFSVKDVEGKQTVKLSGLKGKPVVLIFGSCTWPPFVASVGAIEKLYASYKDKAHIYVVYIREAHPTDGRAVPNNKFKIADPKSLEERQKVAKEFAAQLKLSIPVLVDGVDDAIDKNYAGWPDRLYIIDAAGKIAHKGAPGPGGFSPAVKAAPAALDKLLSGK